jgi:hypothetical protein
MESRLRVGRVIAKTEQEAAYLLMGQIKKHALFDHPPALATDGLGAYRDAMLFEWGKVPEYCGRGKPPTLPQPSEDWKYLQIVKIREGSKLVDVIPKVVYGDPTEVTNLLGKSTAYVERTHLTSRQMNGRLVRKTLSFSKELRLLDAACALEDAIYNFTRPVRTLHVELDKPTRQARWQPRTPAMAAGLTDHIWTVKELLSVVLL